MDKVGLVLDALDKVCPYTHIESSTELIDSGILTSIDLFELIAELESRFNIRIPEELIEAENFVTAETIAEIVLRGVNA